MSQPNRFCGNRKLAVGEKASVFLEFIPIVIGSSKLYHSSKSEYFVLINWERDEYKIIGNHYFDCSNKTGKCERENKRYKGKKRTVSKNI